MTACRRSRSRRVLPRPRSAPDRHRSWRWPTVSCAGSPATGASSTSRADTSTSDCKRRAARRETWSSPTTTSTRSSSIWWRPGCASPTTTWQVASSPCARRWRWRSRTAFRARMRRVTNTCPAWPRTCATSTPRLATSSSTTRWRATSAERSAWPPCRICGGGSRSGWASTKRRRTTRRRRPRPIVASAATRSRRTAWFNWPRRRRAWVTWPRHRRRGNRRGNATSRWRRSRTPAPVGSSSPTGVARRATWRVHAAKCRPSSRRWRTWACSTAPMHRWAPAWRDGGSCRLPAMTGPRSNSSWRGRSSSARWHGSPIPRRAVGCWRARRCTARSSRRHAAGGRAQRISSAAAGSRKEPRSPPAPVQSPASSRSRSPRRSR